MYLGGADAVYDSPVHERRATLQWCRSQEDSVERPVHAPLSIEDLAAWAARIGLTKKKQGGLHDG